MSTVEASQMRPWIDDVIPPGVVSECMSIESANEAHLYALETAYMEKAVEKRRKEFAAGRACARRALARVGIRSCPIPVGSMREPLWPAGITGSITHDGEYAVVAVAPVRDVGLLGIDLASREPLKPELRKLICLEDEIAAAEIDASGVCSDPFKVLFCIKESVYKCLFPLVRKLFDFHDVSVAFSEQPGRVEITLLNRGLFARSGVALTARYGLAGDYIFSAVWGHGRVDGSAPGGSHGIRAL